MRQTAVCSPNNGVGSLLKDVEAGEMHGEDESLVSKNALAVLKPVYDELAAEQHGLMKACTQSMRQGDQQKDLLALVEETINKFVSFAKSCAGNTLDTTATDRLEEIQGQFAHDKDRLLEKVAKNEECNDLIQDQQYRVAKQLSWLMSLLQRLIYGSEPRTAKGDPSTNSAAEDNSTNRAPDGSDAAQEVIHSSAIPTDEQSTDSSKAHYKSFGSVPVNDIRTIGPFANASESQNPDSAWAATVWKIIDSETQREASKGSERNDVPSP